MRFNTKTTVFQGAVWESAGCTENSMTTTFFGYGVARPFWEFQAKFNSLKDWKKQPFKAENNVAIQY